MSNKNRSKKEIEEFKFAQNYHCFKLLGIDVTKDPNCTEAEAEVLRKIVEKYSIWYG